MQIPSKIENLTPHDINFLSDNGHVMLSLKATRHDPSKCPCEGGCDDCVPRVDMDYGPKSWVSVPLEDEAFIFFRDSRAGQVVRLPPQSPGVAYVVSAQIASALRNSRDDLFVPGEQCRDDSGRIIGCRGLDRPR